MVDGRRSMVGGLGMEMEEMRWHGGFVVAVLVLLVPVAAVAQIEPLREQLPARSVGMAGVGRSFANAGSALYLNPAALGIYRQYILGGSYGYHYADGAEANAVSVEWTDSSPNPFNMGLGFGFDFVPHDENDYFGYNGAFSYSAGAGGSAALHFGVGGHGLYNVSGLEDDVWSFDVGVALDFSQTLRIGAVGYNLVRSGEVAGEKLPRGTGGGISFWTGPVMLAADATALFAVPDEASGEEKTRVTYAGAVQVAPVNEVALRMGVSHDQDPSKTRLAGGLSIIVEQAFGLSFGYQQAISDDTEIIAAVTMEIYNPFGPPQM